MRDDNILLTPLAGIFLGIAGLIWTGTFYYVALLAFYWFIGLTFRKLNLRDHAVMFMTFTIFALSAGLWHLPYFMKYGLSYFSNVDPILLKGSEWRPIDASNKFAVFIFKQIPFYILGGIGFILILEEREVNKLLQALLIMAGILLIIVTSFRFQQIFLRYGIALCAPYPLVFLDELSQRGGKKRWKTRLRAIAVLFSLFAIFSVHNLAQTSTFRINYYRKVEQCLNEALKEPNQTIIADYVEGAIISWCGHRNVWDINWGWLPPWARDRPKLIADFYLSNSEQEALEIARRLNATHVLVSFYYINPFTYSFAKRLLEIEYGDEELEEFFNITYIRSYGRISGYHALGPSPKGIDLLISRLLWNEEAEILGIPPPDPLEHFKLIYVSPDKKILLYEIVYPDDG